MYQSFFFLLIISILISCTGETEYVPKPRIFPKVDYPVKKYKTLEQESCPFTLEIPTYSTIIKDKTFFGEDPPHPCWFDIYFGDFNANIYFSYVKIERSKPLEDLISDSYEIVNQINLRSDFMQEIPLVADNLQTGGLIFEFEGDAASPMHFFLTDSTEHFLKGALYFNTEPRPDSLAPVINFLEEDVYHMIETFRWK